MRMYGSPSASACFLPANGHLRFMSALLQTAAAHFERGELDQADALCVEILATVPSADAYHLRGLIAITRRDFVPAAEHLSKAIELAPDSYEMHLRLGGVLLALEDRERAAIIIEKAVALNPQDREAHLYLGQALLLQKRYDEANAAALQALAMSPEWPRALEVLALIAIDNGRSERAEQLATRVILAEPERAIPHRIIGDILTRSRDYETARERYETALRIEPKDGRTLANYALFLSRVGETEKAAELYQKSLRYLPHNAGALHGLSTALLKMGQLEEGWRLFSNRRTTQKLEPRHENLPVLKRAPQAGERVLAWLDEGVGDQIMWASLIPDLQQTGADIVVECEERLIPLFQRSFPGVAFMPWTKPQSPIPGAAPSAQFSISDDAAAWFRKSFDAFPGQKYLTAHAPLVQELRARYRREPLGTPLIGISWRTSGPVKITDEKTLPLNQWGPLLYMPGAAFVDLQYGDCDDEIALAQKQFGVRIESDASIDPMSNMDAFAAQVAAMDLVITTSNATAHVAGALGVPTWVLVPHGYGAIWHWFSGRDDSPWYPATRIFRQTKKDDWGSVVDAASEALAEFVETRRRNAANS